MNEKRRLLVLNYEFPPLGGGASPVSYDIALKLSETGNFDVDVVTMGYRDLPKYEVVNSHFRIYRVPCIRTKKEICYPWEQATYLVTAWFKCVSLIKKNNYDLCHAHFLIPTGILALALKKRFGLEYVVTSHGSDVPGFNPDRFTLLHKITGPLLRMVIRNAKKVITPSHYLKNLILNNISQESEGKSLVIPNGIDTEQFKTVEKYKTIFSSGRLLKRKGFQHLISAVSDNNMGYEVHIAGDGPMLEELKVLAENSKTPIIFHGWLDNKSSQYKNLLETASLFVHMSESESFGMTLVEAMSAGCVIVSADAPGSMETIGEAGIVVSGGSAHELKEQLEKLIQNPVLMDELRTKAKKRVHENFGWEIVIKKHVEAHK